jgi:xanthine/CO dehydrogenase XdhC/CoxF family maturation factor
MSSSLQRLLPLFERDWARHLPLVLATLVRTDGSTYTKPGAHMLIAGNGEYAGLLSGGCLEGVFGLGSGCEGTMDILLRRLDGSNVIGNYEALLWRC